MKFDVKDMSLAEGGRLRSEWAAGDMPVLKLIRERFHKELPFKGIRISGCLHITTETANLGLALKDGGAELVLCASNPLSTQDAVAAYLVQAGIPTFAIKGEDNKTYYKHIMSALAHKPNLTVDDGADLVSIIHQEKRGLIPQIMGGTEETTTGVIRLRNMASDGSLKYPIIAVNDARTKHFFDNRYGTGQSTIDGITRATNLLWAGKKVVVCGYGWCGRGIASRARGMGAHVIVTEINPIAALEAAMDGLQVMPLQQAAAVGEVFITATGNTSVIDSQHFARMKSGAVLANSGHFNVEINIPALEKLSIAKRQMRPFVEEYSMRDGRKIYLLGEGRLINLAAAEGHPASVMDMSFANQALCIEDLIINRGKRKAAVYGVPDEIDKMIGVLKLKAMGISIDKLTKQQQKYLRSWESGT
ncbi:MAG TPA: adenosylhomocysteinase [Dehalococcoidia bacterium]|nr:adenosylhomocysteinase [Dehalococcoidia bacterium]